MTPFAQTELIIYCLIILSAVYFATWSYWLNRRKRKPEPPAAPEIAFRFPDRVSIEYLDAAGNVMASRWYVMEKPGE